MAANDSSPLVYTPDEVKKLLRISRGLVYEAIRIGQIPSIRIGRRILIPRAALERLISEEKGHRSGERQ